MGEPMRKYVNKNSDEVENKYDFIPNETSTYVAKNSINKTCLAMTKRIAENREQNAPTDDLEKKLTEFRDYGESLLLPKARENNSFNEFGLKAERGL